jgi:hypothetical protein
MPVQLPLVSPVIAFARVDVADGAAEQRRHSPAAVRYVFVGSVGALGTGTGASITAVTVIDAVSVKSSLCTTAVALRGVSILRSRRLSPETAATAVELAKRLLVAGL